MRHFIKINFISIILFCCAADAQNTPEVYTSAGPGQSICASWDAYLTGYMGDSVASPVWTTSGDGTFSDSNALSTSYTPGAADIGARSVILTLRASQIGFLHTVSDDMTLTIIPSVPSQPAPVTGAPSTACPPLNGIILRTDSDPEATNYVWSSVHPGVNFVPPSTADTQAINLYSITSPEYVIHVTAFNLCGASPARPVHIRRTVIVSSLKGVTTACANTIKPYSCNSVKGAVSYKWKSTGGIRFSNHTNLYLTSDTLVNVSFQTGFSSGTISVAAMTACFTGPFKTLSVSKSLPPLGEVSGIASVCPVISQTYSVPAVPGTAGYTWTLPAHTTGTSAANAINVDFESSFADSGSLCVTATSQCGIATAPVCKTIYKAPPPIPENITGPVTGVCGQTVTYSTAGMEGVTYNWMIPSGAIINGSQTGNSILVTMPENMNSGRIRVSGTNDCGTSPLRNLNIKGSPPKPGRITTNIYPVYALTAGAQFSSNVSALGTGCTFAWTYPPAATYKSGQGTSELVLDWGNDNGTVTLTAANSCGTSSRDYYVNIYAKREVGNMAEPGEDVNEKATEKKNGLFNLQAYPDEDRRVMTITFFAPAQAVYSYSLYDDSNHEILKENIDANEGVNMFEIDMASFPAHIVYRLELSDGKDATHILVKMK
ncbi:MAG TPA: hypothetical protein VJY62_13110 [Bacteroidia bacterium]|nr:hypothetical protein [Bacteroidia bacterium]